MHTIFIITNSTCVQNKIVDMALQCLKIAFIDCQNQSCGLTGSPHLHHMCAWLSLCMFNERTGK